MGLIGRDERGIVSVDPREMLCVGAAEDPAGYALERGKIVFHLVPFLSVTGVLSLSERDLNNSAGRLYMQSEKNIVGPTGEIGKGEAFY